MASKVITIAGVSAVAIAAILYPFVLPKLKTFGIVGREYGELNNKQCRPIPSLRTCEDTWLHEDSGYLYAACGNSIADRMTWFPCEDHWDALNRPHNDYLAVLDTRSTQGDFEARTRKVRLEGFYGLAGEGSFTSHGMGVWEDPTPGSDRLRIFLVNHRPSLDGLIHAVVLDETTGANSTIEIFETNVGSDVAQHIRTVAHPLIRTPNDVQPSGPDSFYFTNDHHVKRGWKKQLDAIFPLTDAGFCDADGCKIVMDKLSFANGISRSAAPNEEDIYYLSMSASDKFYVIQRQPHDNSLILKDSIYFPYATDNLYTTKSGAVYIASFPSLHHLTEHFTNPREKGSQALIAKLSKNLHGKDAFFGEKYKIEKVFEDDRIGPDSPSGITGVAVDEQRGRIYLAALKQEMMWECDLYEEPVRMKF